MYVNEQFVAGHLGQDAKIVALRDERFAVNFSVAATRRYWAGKEQKERTTWVEVKHYTTEKGSEYFKDKLLRGTLVFVTGEHLVDEREDDSGQKHRYPFLRADDIEVLRQPEGAKVTTGSTQAAPAESKLPPNAADRFDTADF